MAEIWKNLLGIREICFNWIQICLWTWNMVDECSFVNCLLTSVCETKFQRYLIIYAMLLHFEISPSFDIGSYIFSFFCFDTLTFPIVAKLMSLQVKVLMTYYMLFMDWKQKRKPTRTLMYYEFTKNQSNSVIFRARLHFSLH